MSSELVRPTALPMYQCLIALPEHLPIPSGHRVIVTTHPRLRDEFIPAEIPVGYDEALATNGFVELRFFQTMGPVSDVETGAVRAVAAKVWPDVTQVNAKVARDAVPVTVVCATTPRLHLYESEKGLPLDDACIERIASDLSSVIEAYALMTKDARQPPVSIYTLDMLLLARHVFSNGSPPGELFIHMMPGRLKHGRDTLTDSQMEGLMTWRGNIRDGHPFAHFLRFTAASRRSLYYYGEPAIAVVQAQTAAEVLLNGVLRLTLMESLRSNETVDRVMSRPFRQRVTGALPELFGGDWRLEGAGPVSIWWNNTYAVRNRVTHEGANITYSEAQNAVGGVGALEAFVDALLQSNVARWKVAAILKFGKPGLARRNLLDAAMNEAIQRFMDLPFPWWRNINNTPPTVSR